MSVITKDLGVATAYGYAKSKGYTGTEEEFAELMASYADVAQQAEASAQDAEDAKDAAITAKTAAQTAQTAAESAQTAAAGSAQTASTKASEASNSAQTAAGSATAAGDSATAAAGSAETAQTAAQTATTKASEASSSASAASTAKTGAETARTGAQTAQAAAETAQANAEAAASSVSASAAQIEQNTEEIGAIKNDLSDMNTATASDEGKALKVKTVTNGKVSAWEFGDAGGSSDDIHYYQLNDDTKRKYFPNHINHILEENWELESGTLNNNTGEEVDNLSYTRSGFIPVEGGKTYLLCNKDGQTQYHVHLYDSEKTFVLVKYDSSSINLSADGYMRIKWANRYDAETTLISFLDGYWGLLKDYTSGMDFFAPAIYTEDFEVVEANKIADQVKVSAAASERITAEENMGSVLYNNNINLLDRTKLEPNYSVNKEGTVISAASASSCVMRAMPIKPNTVYTISLFSSWGAVYPCWLDSFGENVISMISGTYGQSVTVTSPENAYYLRFGLSNSENETTKKLMIVESDTLPSTFVANVPDNYKLKRNLLPDNIETDMFDVVEANKIADDVVIGQTAINEITKLSTLQSVTENVSVNLFNKNALEIGYNVNTSGEIINSGVGAGVIRAMPIFPSTEYSFTKIGGMAFVNPCWLDNNENVISMIASGSPVTATSPANAYYLRFGIRDPETSVTDYTKAMIVKGDTIPTEYVPYTESYKIKKELLPGAKGNKDWTGLKYIAIGDSRTAGYAATTDGTTTWDPDESGEHRYPNMIGYYTGISVDNRSTPGGAFANRTEAGFYDKSFDYQTENLPSDADMITVFLGTNDRVIGSDNPNLNPTTERDNPDNPFDAETFMGAIRNGIKKIRQAMPEVPIIFIVDDIGFNATAYDGGTTRKDMIKLVARQAGLPVIDLAECGMQQDTLNNLIYNGVRNKYWYHTDILHESILGQKMIAKSLAGEMAKYLW